MTLQEMIKEFEKEMDKSLANPMRMSFNDRIRVVSNEPNYCGMLRGSGIGEALKKIAKYKVGDRVENIKLDPMRPSLVGKVGTIKAVLTNFVEGERCFFYTIQFDNFNLGHNGGLAGSTLQDHWVLEEEFIKLTCQKAKKERMSLSTLAKRTFDPDTKALVEVGLLSNDLRVSDPSLLLDMLISINFKALAIEAKKRLAEAKAEVK